MSKGLFLKAGAGERVLGYILLRGSEEGEGFGWGCLQAGAVGLYPTEGLVLGQGCCGN